MGSLDAPLTAATGQLHTLKLAGNSHSCTRSVLAKCQDLTEQKPIKCDKIDHYASLVTDAAHSFLVNKGITNYDRSALSYKAELISDSEIRGSVGVYADKIWIPLVTVFTDRNTGLSMNHLVKTQQV